MYVLCESKLKAKKLRQSDYGLIKNVIFVGLFKQIEIEKGLLIKGKPNKLALSKFYKLDKKFPENSFVLCLDDMAEWAITGSKPKTYTDRRLILSPNIRCEPVILAISLRNEKLLNDAIMATKNLEQAFYL